jgi:lactobin A/cerein 7B family class IIb bacteriocin
MSFEFESVNHCQSDTSGLNIARSHLLEDEEGLSTELGDDELEQVSGGIAPLIAIGVGIVVRTAVKATVREFGRGFAEGFAEDRC